uniref:Uncharacterized protein n=1 Tax=Rhizophagus irregularis (strain DAOM 181602 / DAOM 197198 / MUCL 43194) TaxID=747089 RepID=U9TCV2_RHIID
MLSKISTICYIHDSNERIYIKAFIPSDKNIETQIEDFEKGDMICLRGKFIACAGWFTINATSIKVIDGMDFDIMPPVGLSIMLEFWIEVNHDPNIRYLSNKTNSINQNIRSITAIIVSIINYEPPVINDMTQEEIAAEKHVVKLEDISLGVGPGQTGLQEVRHQEHQEEVFLTRSSGSKGSMITLKSMTPFSNLYSFC